jgi:hypothetical protein
MERAQKINGHKGNGAKTAINAAQKLTTDTLCGIVS